MPEWLFMKKSLVALAVGTFSLGISEFGMMGILSDVASGVGVDIATAGHLVSAYSLGVAVGAPMLIAMRLLEMPLQPRHRVFIRLFVPVLFPVFRTVRFSVPEQLYAQGLPTMAMAQKQWL